MVLISLFNGISGARLGAERAGFTIDKFYSSEIDKYAMQVSAKNYPDIIELGDVKNYESWEIEKPDLIVAGFPCQPYSIAGKRNGLSDERGGSIVDAMFGVIEKFKPTYLLLENVKGLLSIDKGNTFKYIIEKLNSLEYNVDWKIINSSLVSAQNRERVFISNIPFDQPQDKGILLKDIVHENESINTALSGNYAEWFAKNAEFQLNKKYSSLSPEKAITMTARQYANWNVNYWFEILSEYIVPFDKTLQILDKEVQRGKVGYFRKDSQANRVYYIHDKAITLTGEAGGGVAKMGQYLFGHTKKNSQGNRVYTEEEKSACLNAASGGTAGVGNILFGCITPDRVEKRQNGQRFNDGKKFYTLTAQDRHGILIEGYIRKLTPVECERLQTYPDGWTEGISKTQRYKALGNSFTVDVIAHILGGIDD